MGFTRFGVRINCLLRLVDRSCLVLHLWRWVKGYGMAFGNSRCLRKSDIFYGELSERRCLPSLIRSSGKWWLKVFVSSVVTQMKIASMLYGYVIQLSPFGCLISVFPFCVQRSFPHLKMFFAFYVGKFHASWWSSSPWLRGVFESVRTGFGRDKRCGVLMRCVIGPLIC